MCLGPTELADKKKWQETHRELQALERYLKDVWDVYSVTQLDPVSIGYILQNVNGDFNDCDRAEIMIRDFDKKIWLEYARINHLPANQKSMDYWQSTHYKWKLAERRKIIRDAV